MNDLTIRGQSLFYFSAAYTSTYKRLDGALSLHGISFTELTVLHHLALAPKLTLSRVELSRVTGLTASGITRLLNPMEKMGLVSKEKNIRDARMSLVKLTEPGQDVYSNGIDSFTLAADNITSGLTSDEVSTFLTLLGKLR